MSERGRAVLAAHGPTGLCQYYASGALYRLVEQVLGLVNTLRYRWAASDPIEVHLFTGHSFRLPSGDAGIGIELMSGIREPNATRYLASFLRNDDVILDIGANIGYYVAVERHLAPGAPIHAVEPVPANLALLRQNAPPDVAVYPVAISDHIGTAPIYIPDHCNWATLNQQHAGTLAGVHTEQVPVTTLDRFCTEHNLAPTFLRMDTEGSEVEILLGARSLIESDRPLRLMIELHAAARRPGEIEALMRYLLDAGFVIRAVVHEPNHDLGVPRSTFPWLWYDLLWSSIPGDDHAKLVQLMRWGFCPNVFLERTSTTPG